MKTATNNIFKLQSYHHGNLKYALIKAAETMLETDGSASVSLRKIAKLIGVSAAATYHQFENKEALLSEVASVGFQKIITLYENQVNASDTPERKLNLFVEIYCNFAMQNSHLFHLMFGDTLDKQYYPTLYDNFIQCRTMFEKAIKNFLDYYQMALDEKTMLWRYWSILQGGITLALNYKSYGEIQSQAEIIKKIQAMITDDLHGYAAHKNKAIFCEVS